MTVSFYPSNGAVSKTLRARGSKHSSNFFKQLERRPTIARTQFKLNETIRYPWALSYRNWQVKIARVDKVLLWARLCSSQNIFCLLSGRDRGGVWHDGVHWQNSKHKRNMNRRSQRPPGYCNEFCWQPPHHISKDDVFNRLPQRRLVMINKSKLLRGLL